MLYKPPDGILELSSKDQADLNVMDYLVTTFRISAALSKQVPDWLKEKFPPMRDTHGSKPERDPRTICKNVIGKPKYPITDVSFTTFIDGLLASGLVPGNFRIYIRKLINGQPNYQINITWTKSRSTDDTEQSFEERHRMTEMLRDWFRHYSWDMFAREYRLLSEPRPSLVVALSGRKNIPPPSMRHKELRVEKSILYLT